MIYVDGKINCICVGNRLSLDVSNDKIKVVVLKEGVEDNWGDDDCHKMVTTLTDCDVIISAELKDEFEGVEDISLVRYNYYKPCYYIDHNLAELKDREVRPDGTIIFHYRAK